MSTNQNIHLMKNITLKKMAKSLNRGELSKISGGKQAQTVCQRWLEADYVTCFNCCLTAFVDEIEHCDNIC